MLSPRGARGVKKAELNGMLIQYASPARRRNDITERHKDELYSLTARTKELEAAAKAAEQLKLNEI
jgi:hypothetical protein